jgi:hypothetical protein
MKIIEGEVGQNISMREAIIFGYPSKYIFYKRKARILEMIV